MNTESLTKTEDTKSKQKNKIVKICFIIICALTAIIFIVVYNNIHKNDYKKIAGKYYCILLQENTASDYSYNTRNKYIVSFNNDGTYTVENFLLNTESDEPTDKETLFSSSGNWKATPKGIHINFVNNSYDYRKFRLKNDCLIIEKLGFGIEGFIDAETKLKLMKYIDEENSTTHENTTTKLTNTETSIPITMESQFEEIGFNKEEARRIAKQFRTMGFTDVSNIQFAIGDGSIDGLQSFTCNIFDYTNVTLLFTIENRKLCYVELGGLTKTEYKAYFNLFGNLKYKAEDSTTSIVMFDIWDDNGEVIPGAVGYKAVFDHANEKISEYK